MFKIFGSLLFLILFISGLSGQMYIGISGTPAYYTPRLDTLFLPGTFNNWQPDALSHQFNAQGFVVVEPFSGQAEYKVTRGNWASVEANASGNDISNRILEYKAGDTVWIEVKNWRDVYRSSHTIDGDVQILQSGFYMPQFNRSRRIWVYLPEDYDASGLSYPVLYMHDGQNLFDAPYSFAGEWRIDESMQSAKDSFVRDCIVIGIDNGGGHRIEEYTPHTHPNYGGGRGEDYVDFLVHKLKPFIDSHFRTLSQPQHTGIAGSSLGGLISFYAGMKFPDVFGRVGVFSPSFWYSDSLSMVVQEHVPSTEQRYYIMGARNEDADMEPDIDHYIQLMQAQGVHPDQIKRVIRAQGAHSEWFWAQEFGACYQWLNLWDKRLESNDRQEAHESIFFAINENPSQRPIISMVKKISGVKHINIYNVSKQLVQSGRMESNAFNVNDSLAAGVYFATIHIGDTYKTTLKFVKL